ncbi:MAG: PP2C family protein-serine/threonine phosphatase [Phycisphaerae bacterium]
MLLLHLFLLMLVVVVVLGAARSIYHSARAQAIKQSAERLDLLSQQTARGIENYYVSIMSDLQALLQDQSEAAAATQEWIPPRNRIGNLRQRFQQRPALVDQRSMSMMWKQLNGRVADLFVVDNETGKVVGHYPETKDALEFGERLAAKHMEWLRGLKETSISTLQREAANPVGDYHLIAVPALAMQPFPRNTEARNGPESRNGEAGAGAPPPPGSPGGPGSEGPAGGRPLQRFFGGPDPQRLPVLKPRTVVAVVPISEVRERFFDSLNQKGVVNAALLDDAGTVLVSINPKFIGMNVLANISAGARESMQGLITGSEEGTRVVDQPYSIGGETMAGRILAFRDIKDLPGRKWTVLTSSPVSDAELLVKDMFRDALLWAIILSISVTIILASTSYFMIRSRVRYERARHDLLARELDQARQIQLAWLPDAANPPAGLEVSAANLPASHISGDFYNWFHLPAPAYSKQTAEHIEDGADASRIAIVIGDVTGHGMAAAFLMATTQLLVRTTLSRYQDPGRCLQEVNKQLCTQGFRGQFVTMLVMVLDPRSSSIEIATAGHPAPLVERHGKFESLEMEPQLVLGVDPTETYKTEGFILEPGASIMLYTDGVVEAEADGGEQYGLDRLCAALAAVKNGGEKASEMRIQAVLQDVKRFCANKDLADDVTLVAVRTTAAAVGISAGIGV